LALLLTRLAALPPLLLSSGCPPSSLLPLPPPLLCCCRRGCAAAALLAYGRIWVRVSKPGAPRTVDPVQDRLQVVTLPGVLAVKQLQQLEDKMLVHVPGDTQGTAGAPSVSIRSSHVKGSSPRVLSRGATMRGPAAHSQCIAMAAAATGPPLRATSAARAAPYSLHTLLRARLTFWPPWHPCRWTRCTAAGTRTRSNGDIMVPPRGAQRRQ
jgi:hypothetical protein